MKSAWIAAAFVAACAPAVVPVAPLAPVVVPVAPLASAAPMGSAPAVDPPPDVPSGCFGRDLSLALAFQNDHCAAVGPDASAPPGVTITANAVATSVAPGEAVTILVRMRNDTDQPQSLWFRHGVHTPAAITLLAFDQRDRNVDSAPDSIGIGRLEMPADLHVVLAPHGVATGEVVWHADGYPQDAAPAKSRKGPKATLASMDGDPPPLAPGKYYLEVSTQLVEQPELRVDILVK